MKLNTTNANTEKGKFTKDILDFFLLNHIGLNHY